MPIALCWLGFFLGHSGDFAAGQSGDSSYLQRSAESWAAELNHPQSARRRAAAFALGKLGVHSLPQLGKLCQALRSDVEPAVRIALATALGEVGTLSPREAIAALQEALQKDQSVLVQRASARALGALGSRAGIAVPALRTALTQADSGLRQNAAWALGQIGHPAAPAVPNLIEALKDSDALVRQEAVLAAGNLGYLALDTLPALIGSLGDRDTLVRESTVLALRHFGPLASPAIFGLLEVAEAKDQPTSLRRSALLAIEQLWPAGHVDAVVWERLLRCSKDGQPEEVRQCAAAAAMRIQALHR